MKNFVVIVLSLLHLASTTGASLHMHYCMGELANWGLVQNNSGICEQCGMKKNNKSLNDCCKDKTTFLKNNTDQKTPETFIQLINTLTVSLPFSIIELAAFQVIFSTNTPIIHTPPLRSSIATYIFNCIFRN